MKKMDQLLTGLIKENRERTQINKIRNERGEITTDAIETQIVRKYHKRLHANQLNNSLTWINSKKHQSSETDSRRIRKSEQTNYN